MPRIFGSQRGLLKTHAALPEFRLNDFDSIHSLMDELLYVPLKETIKGFQAILGGDVDDLPEQAFLLCGTIDEVIAKRGSF